MPEMAEVGFSGAFSLLLSFCVKESKEK